VRADVVWGARGCTNTTLANRQPETRQPIVFPPLGKCQSGPGNRARRSELWGAAEWAGVGRLDSRSAENAETGRFLKRCGGSRTRADERAGGPHPHLQNPTSKTPPPKPHLQNPISKPQFRAAVQSRTWVCASPPRLGGLSRQQPAAGSGHVGDSKTLSANSPTAARSGSGPEPFAAVWGEDGARITPRALPRLRGRGSLPQPRQREHCGPPSPCRESLRECGGFP